MKKTIAIESHICELLKKSPVNVVLDVGAHRGESGTTFRELGFTGRIISFEPIPENLVELKRVASKDPNWQVVPYALGDADGEVAMHQASSTVLSSLHAPTDHGRDHFGSNLKETKLISINVRRLDSLVGSLLSDIEQPDIYLKIDTQGHDIEVLKGAENTLRNVKILQTESSVRPIYQGAPTFREIYDVAESLGFKLSGYFIGSRAASLALNEMDAVFVREGSAGFTDS